MKKIHFYLFRSLSDRVFRWARKNRFLGAVLGGGVVLGILILAGVIFEKSQPTESLFGNRGGEEKEIPSLLKVGFVTDWEYGHRKRMKHKLTLQALPELERAVSYFNDFFHPDIVVGGGDYIESTGIKPERAREQLALANGIFQKLHAPRLYALGNHDMRVLDKAAVREVLGIESNHTIRDIGDWRIVVLDTNFNKEDGSDRASKSYVVGFVSDAELAWLSEALRTDRPVIVFSHHAPIMAPNVDGTFVLNIVNAPQVRQVLEEAGNVVAVVSGHNPFGYYEERNGIHYFVVDTLVNEKSLGSFAALELRYLPSKRHAEIFFRRLGQNQRLLQVVDRTLGENEKDIIPELFPDTPEETMSDPQAEGDDKF